jgi:hypothetical protein
MKRRTVKRKRKKVAVRPSYKRRKRVSRRTVVKRYSRFGRLIKIKKVSKKRKTTKRRRRGYTQGITFAGGQVRYFKFKKKPTKKQIKKAALEYIKDHPELYYHN